MAILPVYTTSKLHAARINLRQTPSSTPGVLFNHSDSKTFISRFKLMKTAHLEVIINSHMYTSPSAHTFLHLEHDSSPLKFTSTHHWCCHLAFYTAQHYVYHEPYIVIVYRD